MLKWKSRFLAGSLLSLLFVNVSAGPCDAYFTFDGTLADSSGNGYDTYILYNRRYTQESNLSPEGSGGQRTEVRVYPAGALAPQLYLNQHPEDSVA